MLHKDMVKGLNTIVVFSIETRMGCPRSCQLLMAQKGQSRRHGRLERANACLSQYIVKERKGIISFYHLPLICLIPFVCLSLSHLSPSPSPSLPLFYLPQSNTQSSVVVVMLDPGMTESLYVSVCSSKLCNLK